ncbi:glycosyltransferase family 4 protein [Phycicoccus sp. BSK3Z-2]|uniref:D-inositol 3-phosphate glycosyltransferase n=1 Tax=Phycicoccus avicenniae TaxID=2828860 RepID=A0A941DAV8_9MICO|nr:glycosyltransferase family 4 protein [Phycicoccus avicenniae]MBR7743612.1 glycosyltransferase family 4 protein [Phycicoccus avicenniae]
MAGWALVKVALLSDCYPPRLGGIERQVHDLAHRLTAAGHAVEVFTATSGPDGERHGATTVEGDVVVHRMALGLPGDVPVNPLAPREVRRRLERGGFDVAHAHLGVVSPFATDLVGTALDADLPVLATFHCALGHNRHWMAAAGHVGRWARRGVALDAVSRMTAAQVSGVAGGARVEVLHNGIDAAWWAHGEHTPDPAGLHVVTAIRLVSRKRPLVLLRTLERARALLDPSVTMRATVPGAGPQRRVMEAYLRARGMDWVSLPGRLDRETLRELHHTADVYLSVALLEAFGIAALEARSAGVPVVTRTGTGVEDIVTHGVDGLLVDTDEALALAVAGLGADRGRLAALTSGARARPPRQEWDAVLGAHLAEYRRAREER